MEIVMNAQASQHTAINRGPLFPKPVLILAILMLLAGYQLSKAQTAEGMVAKGERVRIKAPSVKSGNLYGHVAHTSEDALLLTNKDTTYTLVYSSIETISVYAGKKRHFGKGALIGALSGALIMGSITASNNKSDESTPDENCVWFCDGFISFSDGQAFAIGAVAGTLIGGIGGGLIGTFIRTPRWEEVPVDIALGMPALPAYATQNGRSIGAGVSFRFSLNNKR